MTGRYGTFEWFENMFKLSDDDPWGNSWRGIEQHRYDLVIKLIKEHILNETKINNELKFLDIGCTTGNFTNILYKLNRNVIGIDISKTAIKKAKAKFKYIDFIVDSLPNSGFQNNTSI
jgi:2-polyprenyl-3-methyl-5-hydroxy-6-metoxy-1,4-benzoquinol methylase